MKDLLILLAMAAVVLPLLYLFLRLCFRTLRTCYREIMDCIWVAKRGVMNPLQVREEFIATMGREPTIAEVHDLQEMIRAEHRQAVTGLLSVLAGIVGVLYVFHRATQGKGPF